jgi:hypothetical protein
MAANFSDKTEQHPANIVAPNGFVGSHKLFFVGATGNVGTGYGIPGVSATRVSTGIYRIQHPAIKGLDIIPGIAVPSGAPAYHVKQITDGVGGTNSLSGTTEFHISTDQRIGSGAAAGVGSGLAGQLANPVSGTILRLAFFAAPLAVPPGQF